MMALRVFIHISPLHIAYFPFHNLYPSLRTTRLYSLKPTRFELRTYASKDTSDELQEPEGEWKVTKSSILQEIQPIQHLVKDILHSPRYKDGELLSPEDENKIIKNLLPYHPHALDKIGCGVDSIMVGRHPQFESSRCLFIIREDGRFTDFSYKKCLIGLIQKKYPSSAEKFIDRYFKQNN